MKKTLIFTFFALFISLSTLTFTSCREQTTSEKVEDSVEDMGDDIEDGLEDAGDEIEDAVDE
ncbi:hypothetical protein H0I23_15675 [Cellulophaga sp. HaHaR_3_176]|uniref:hypothetical protein n=1 Tax=Cellulophaga sp. HaHaR_3_176 TaxID=1942464 RepID=UPI001C1F70A9|nr:hypothetical protein [Cellulophaga sp. HaHaR_3_176]QWX83869.1 hypothetical protein H0I23_15675 [Cellulophaga sp. HaHaR_3_176]